MSVIARLLQAIAYLFKFFPFRRRIVFMSRQNSKLSLDFRLLIDELEIERPQIEIITCLTNPETSKKNLPQFIVGTIKQLYYVQTSSIIIIDGYIPAVSIPKKRAKTTVVQMWHALGAIKKFGLQCLDTPAGRTSSAAKNAHMHENYDYIIAGGPGAITAYSNAFGYPENIIKPFGLPRIDYLLDPASDSPRHKKAASLARCNPFLNNGKINILYAPTLRKGPGYENWLTESLYHLTEHYGVEYNDSFNLIIAGHPLDLGFDKELLRQYPQVHFIPGTPTIDLLEFADIVVSDYSAIIFEAGLLDKQIDYYLPDYEHYTYSPGLNIDPNNLTVDYIKKYLGNPTYGVTKTISEFILNKLDKK